MHFEALARFIGIPREAFGSRYLKFDRLFGEVRRYEIESDLKRLALHGNLVRSFAFDPKNDKYEWYRVDFTPRQVDEYSARTRDFLERPLAYECHALALSAELEGLVWGKTRSQYSYLELPWYKRLFLEFKQSHPDLASLVPFDPIGKV